MSYFALALEFLKHKAPALMAEMKGKVARDPETGKVEPMMMVWLNQKERECQEAHRIVLEKLNQDNPGNPGANERDAQEIVIANHLDPDTW